ncbi:hypothetical protein F4781DRAFT_420906 [Annulohypoxylon bovei var. microspora]|nr:hypothetical protein F4781DRAFT_420906 [Annulohypoxylon bovei var. microspora]
MPLGYQYRLRAPHDEQDLVGGPLPITTEPHQNPPLIGNLQCDICSEDAPRALIFSLACGHRHCKNCLWSNAHMAYRSKPFMPARCCVVIDNILLADAGVFSARERSDYALRVEELTNPRQRIYCHDKDCNAYIPVAKQTRLDSTCIKCGKVTCTTCHQKSHTGACQSEHLREAQGPDSMLLKLAETNKWKKCPNCKAFVDRSGGCSHMDCACGQTFCYRCGQALGEDPWRHDREECDRVQQQQ